MVGVGADESRGSSGGGEKEAGSFARDFLVTHFRSPWSPVARCPFRVSRVGAVVWRDFNVRRAVVKYESIRTGPGTGRLSLGSGRSTWDSCGLSGESRPVLGPVPGR